MFLFTTALFSGRIFSRDQGLLHGCQDRLGTTAGKRIQIKKPRASGVCYIRRSVFSRSIKKLFYFGMLRAGHLPVSVLGHEDIVLEPAAAYSGDKNRGLHGQHHSRFEHSFFIGRKPRRFGGGQSQAVPDTFLGKFPQTGFLDDSFGDFAYFSRRMPGLTALIASVWPCT